MRKLKFGWQLLICLVIVLKLAHQSEAQLRYVPVGIPTISISSGSFIVAKEAGFYREEGLNVDLVVMRGAPAIQGLIGGTVPFASSGGAGMLPIVRGAPLRIIFNAIPIPSEPEAHAAAIEKVGPFAPVSIPIIPAPPFGITIGIKNGLTLRGPSSRTT